MGMVASVNREAHRTTTWASAEDEEVTSNAGVTGPTGKFVGPLPTRFRVPMVQGRGEKDPAWLIRSVDEAISAEAKWKEVQELKTSMANAHIQAMGGGVYS